MSKSMIDSSFQSCFKTVVDKHLKIREHKYFYAFRFLLVHLVSVSDFQRHSGTGNPRKDTQHMKNKTPAKYRDIFRKKM